MLLLSPTRALALLAVIVLAGCGASPASARTPEARTPEARTPEARAAAVLKKHPVIDGHIDTPWQYRSRVGRRLAELDLASDLSTLDPPMHTDLPRLAKGGVGGVFWSVYVSAELSGAPAIQATLEQIDVVHRLVERHPDRMALARTADEVEAAFKAGRVASLIGLEGGHSIGGSLAALRMMYGLGARYMTLTHWKTLPWADAATDAPQHDGLSPFGEQVIQEMNRLGMLIDLSHVSAETMKDALRLSRAPVIFSHSSAFAVCPHPRNVPDDVLKQVKANGGVVMVNFLPGYVSEALWQHWAARKAEQARLKALNPGDPEAVKAAMDAWKAAHPAPEATMSQVADHIDHLKKMAGVEHIGLGSDFDGMPGGPVGLEDVSKYPVLIAELLRRGYTEAEVGLITSGNVIRALRQAEAVAVKLRATTPPQDPPATGEPVPEHTH